MYSSEFDLYSFPCHFYYFKPPLNSTFFALKMDKREIHESKREIRANPEISSMNDDEEDVMNLHSSFDYKGKLSLPTSSGSWKAASFIIGKIH